MSLSRMFKWGKRKKPGRDSLEVPSGANTPSRSANASIRSPSPGPAPSVANSELVPTPPPQTLTVSPPEQQNETTPKASTSETWTNLATFLDIVNRTPPFAPLAAVIDNLSWFIKAHENVVTMHEEYQALRTQLEATFKDLGGHFSGDIPPAMTTSMQNLCEAIETELKEVYGTQDRKMVSRYMQANHDLDKITGCYRRINVHLERIMLNASLNVWRIVDKQAADAQLRNLTPSMSACYDSAEANIAQRRECAPKTRERVLQDLKDWKDNPRGEKLCWINGMAGTGKTTIATSLCSALHKSHELGASFFCTRSIPVCRDTKLILPTIAYQLARFSSPFRGGLLQVLDQDPDVNTKVPGVQFQRMILEPLQQVARSLPNSVVVVIDALDECDDGDGVGQILEVLLEHASKLPIKFLISSRPEYHIRERIRVSALNQQLILHELDKRMVQADIESYLRAELGSTSIPLSNDQIVALVRRAGVLFIYAATVVRYIRGGNAAVRIAAVLNAPGAEGESSNKTKEIDALYGAVLRSAFTENLEKLEKEWMRSVLYTVVCAQEPLTVDGLAGLLKLESSQVTDALKPFWSVFHVSDSDSAHRVSILHASFPDYILDSTRSKHLSCDSRMYNGLLADLCFQRIERNVPQLNICKLGSSYVLDDDIHDLDARVKENIPLDLLYACQYWAAHLALNGKTNEQIAALDKFLSKRLLLWMEVLHLTKRIGKAVGQINQAITWLGATEQSDRIVLLAQDARRFVTIFATSPVTQSTPHLYTSMLVSWPSDQPIARCYCQRASDIVRMSGIGSTERQLSLLSLMPARSEIKCVTYSPNGAIFAAGTNSGQIHIWDAVSCRMTIDAIRGHTNGIRAIAFSPNSLQICSGSKDKNLCIWDSQTGQRITKPLQGHTDWVRSVAYSPDGAWLASASNDGTVRIWSTDPWQMKGDPLHGPDGRVTSVVFSPDGSILAASSESLICLWDPFHGQMIGDPLKGHTDLVVTLAFMPDGKYLISGSLDNAIRVWNVSTRQPAFDPLLGHQFHIECVTVSPDGSLLATTSIDDTIRIWDTTTWQTQSNLRQTGVARSITFSPDGSLLLSGSADGYMRLWEVSHTVERHMVGRKPQGHNGWVKCVGFSPCGSYIVSGSDDMTVCIWDSQTKELIHPSLEENKDDALSVGFSVDGQYLYSISADRMVCVWETQTGKLDYKIGPIETDGDYYGVYQEDWPVDFLFDGKRVVCGSKSGRIYMWGDNALSFELAGHNTLVTAIAFSPDGKSFASGSKDGEVMVWEVGTGERLLDPLVGNSRQVNSVAFSRDGSLVASGSLDCTICVWSTTTGLLECDPLQGHSQSVRCVTFSHDGKYIASGSDDKSIRIWNVANRGSAAVFNGHTDSVRSVAFSPDGARLVSGSSDTTIRFWTLPTHPSASTDDGLEASSKLTKSDTSLNWTMDGDGWVRDEQNQLLLWVPPDLRRVLLWPQNTMLISRQGCIQLDLSGAMVGPAWANCFSPFPPVSGE